MKKLIINLILVSTSPLLGMNRALQRSVGTVLRRSIIGRFSARGVKTPLRSMRPKRWIGESKARDILKTKGQRQKNLDLFEGKWFKPTGAGFSNTFTPEFIPLVLLASSGRAGLLALGTLIAISYYMEKQEKKMSQLERELERKLKLNKFLSTDEIINAVKSDVEDLSELLNPSSFYGYRLHQETIAQQVNKLARALSVAKTLLPNEFQPSEINSFFDSIASDHPVLILTAITLREDSTYKPSEPDTISKKLLKQFLDYADNKLQKEIDYEMSTGWIYSGKETEAEAMEALKQKYDYWYDKRKRVIEDTKLKAPKKKKTKPPVKKIVTQTDDLELE